MHSTAPRPMPGRRSASTLKALDRAVSQKMHDLPTQCNYRILSRLLGKHINLAVGFTLIQFLGARLANEICSSHAAHKQARRLSWSQSILCSIVLLFLVPKIESSPLKNGKQRRAASCINPVVQNFLTKGFLLMQVPRLVRAGGSFTGRTVRVPARLTRRVARQVTHYRHSKGLRNEHLTAFAGILTGILVSSLIVK